MESSLDNKTEEAIRQPNIESLLVEGNAPPRETEKTALPNEQDPYGALANEQAFGTLKDTDEVFGTPDGTQASASAIAAAEKEEGSGSKLGKLQEKIGSVIGSESLVEKGIAKQQAD